MAQKRPCESEINRDISFKHARCKENGASRLSSSIVSSLEVVLERAYLQGKGELEKVGSEFGVVNAEESENCSVAREPEASSLCSCAIGNACRVHKVHELVAHLPISTEHCYFDVEHFYFDRSVRHIHSDDPYSANFTSSPRKLVPVGPAHQADIPEHSEITPSKDENDELAGFCIIPISDDSDEHKTSPFQAHVEAGKTSPFQAHVEAGNCVSPDTGSARCVEQGITEAREKLKGTLGDEAFKDLGFYEMGEVVAEKWSEEDEVIFHEVVHSNPASLGKKFWDILRLVFPSRTYRELVSYYFNVFILRKRAAQNRYDPRNIDSDDDEWQLSDGNEYDCNNIDGGRGDEEHDSAVESPVPDNDHSPDLHASDEHVDNSHQSWLSHVLEMQTEMLPHYSETDMQDGSCTSFDFRFPDEPAAEAEGDCDRDGHGLGACGDVKRWERCLVTSRCSKSVEFLPTCSVIEEVFGDDSSSFSFQSEG